MAKLYNFGNKNWMAVNKNKYKPEIGYEYSPTTLEQLLEVTPGSSKNKNSFFKLLSLFFDYDVNYTENKRIKSIVIKRVWQNSIVELFDMSRHKPHKSLDIKRWEWKTPMIYMIKLDNNIYVGKTKNPRQRFDKHLKNYEGNLNHTQELLNNGGVMSCIELVDDNDKLSEREAYWIEHYSNNAQYNCLNIIGNKNKEKISKSNEQNKSVSLDL